MIDVVSNCIHDFFLMFQFFFHSFFENTQLGNSLRPVLFIGVAISIILLAIHVIKKVVWGS